MQIIRLDYEYKVEWIISNNVKTFNIVVDKVKVSEMRLAAKVSASS